MQISAVGIRNFKSIRELMIHDIESAFIIVGKNSTGKTVILDAVLAAAGMYEVQKGDFNNPDYNIEIAITFLIDEEDLKRLFLSGTVSRYRRYELWEKDFSAKLPSYQDGKLQFTFIVNRSGQTRYDDGHKKNNPHIKEIFPRIHYIDSNREITELQEELFTIQDAEELKPIREKTCLFDESRICNDCFQCIGYIEKKQPVELSIYETAKLMQYKLANLKIGGFIEQVNACFHRNAGTGVDIGYHMDFHAEELYRPETVVIHKKRKTQGSLATMSAGTKSIYILSLLEAYLNDQNAASFIIMIEDPEIYLHPQLQKTASEILYRLSKKNQVIFSTHSPNLIFNFNSKQIKQVMLDWDAYTTVNPVTDIDEILNDLGYSANDLMNVSFVFIVEGKQDSARLPLLIKKYYSEVYDTDGSLSRTAIIATNSCTNIKTYANLKYMNKLYLKDQFLMIRDSDGKEPEMLKQQLCSYYKQREKADRGNLPHVTEKNVLILKYYSFENYFLDPAIMVKIGVLDSVNQFYTILYQKYREYLHKLSSFRRMRELTGIVIRSKKDLVNHIEQIKIYIRGHNLYDIFYGRYKGEKEVHILEQYIDAAPRENFKDILDAVDQFVFFESKGTK